MNQDTDAMNATNETTEQAAETTAPVALEDRWPIYDIAVKDFKQGGMQKYVFTDPRNYQLVIEFGNPWPEIDVITPNGDVVLHLLVCAMQHHEDEA